jgi:hypothetical protein
MVFIHGAIVYNKRRLAFEVKGRLFVGDSGEFIA